MAKDPVCDMDVVEVVARRNRGQGIQNQSDSLQ
jgi:hypothetical protein